MNTWIEWFGTLASVVVALSLTMRNLKRLRLLSLIGSAAFAVYGFLIGAMPVFGLNAFIVFVNLYYLARMAQAERRKETFEVFYVDPIKDEYVRRFVDVYKEDIRRFFPDFVANPETGSLVGTEACFILREALPVSLVAYRRTSCGDISLVLDYAVPAYRDLKNARYFFSAAAARILASCPAEDGKAVFSASAEVPAHASYLRRLGFREVGRSGRVILFRKEVQA